MRVEIIIDALKLLNVNTRMVENLDLHSSIEVEFNDGNAIYVSEINNNIWVWSRADFITAYNFQTLSNEVFDILFEIKDFTITGQYILSGVNGFFELRALIDGASFSSPENIAYIMQSFCNDLNRLKSVFC